MFTKKFISGIVALQSLMCASVMLVGAPAYADCPCAGVGVPVSGLNGQLVDIWDVGLSANPYQCYAWESTDYTLMSSFLLTPPNGDYAIMQAGVYNQYDYHCRVVMYDEVLFIDGLTQAEAAECKEAIDDACNAPDPDAWCVDPAQTWCWE